MALATIAALFGTPAFGEEGQPGGGDDRAVRLIKIAPVPVSADNTTANGMYSFDISFVADGVYYLADRSNKAVDVLLDKSGASVTQIAPNNGHGPFAGFTPCVAPGHGANDCAGPNGVVAQGKFLFVTDAPSRVLAFDLTQSPPKTVSEVTTKAGEPTRADELAYAPGPGLLLVINNAATPPFATLIRVNKSTGALSVVKNIFLDAARGVDAQNGAEQPVWDPKTGKFYLSIPQIGSSVSHGGVIRIATDGTIEAVYGVDFCGPAGLTLGPRSDLLIGCNTVFDTAGNVWNPTGNITAAPNDVIIDIKSGTIDTRVLGVGAGDQVWFNSGDGNYYATGSGSPFRPIDITPAPPTPTLTAAGATPLAVIDASDQRVLQQVTTYNVPAVTTGPAAGKHPAGTAHSVAANSASNHIFVPLAANNVFSAFAAPNGGSVPDCSTGCIAVFAHTDEDSELASR